MNNTINFLLHQNQELIKEVNLYKKHLNEIN